jgi:hypothetical protein
VFVCLARNSRSTPRLYTQAEQLGLEAAHLRGPQAQSRDPCRLAGDRVAEEHSVRGHGPPTAHDHFRRRLPRAAAVLSHSGLKANDRTQDFNVDIHQVLVVAAPERGEESNLPARACESSTDSLGPPHVMLAHFAAASPCGLDERYFFQRVCARRRRLELIILNCCCRCCCCQCMRTNGRGSDNNGRTGSVLHTRVVINNEEKKNAH